MKKIFSCFILLGVLSGYGQGPGEFGLFGGVQATSVMYTVKGKRQEAEYKYGFQGGFIYKVPFEKNLFFVPSVYYSLKGYKVFLKDTAFPPSAKAIDNNTSIHTIEFAPLIQYDIGDAPGSLFLRGGMALDFALSGKEEFNQRNGPRVFRKMPFSFGDYGRFTAAAVFAIGYESAGRFMIFAHYDHGIGSMNNADGGPAIRHRLLGLSIGKYFRSKKIVIDTRNRE